ncbi:MAG: hypothetical protein ACOZIN_01870, partial [Myxococcota bacterium]
MPITTASGTRTASISYGGAALATGTNYYWRIRFWDSNGFMGPWSSSCLLRINRAPTTPSNVDPLGPYVSTLTPLLTGSTYNDLENNPQAAAQFQLRLAGDTYANGINSGLLGGATTSWLVAPALTEGTQYFWQVRYQDSVGGWSNFSNETSFTVDTIPPTTPGAPFVVSPNPTNGVVTLSWNPPSADSVSGIAGYELYRSNDATTWTVVNPNPVTGLTTSGSINYGYSPPEGSHYYRVRGKDNAGNFSAYSPSSVEVVVDKTAPSTPGQPRV